VAVLIQRTLPGDRSTYYLGYTGYARELLERVGATEGSYLEFSTSDGFRATGTLIRRYEHGNGDFIVLKLKSGYNIGLDPKRISELKVVSEGSSQVGPGSPKATSDLPASSRKVLLLSTGGTIASRVDYRTGTVKPVIDARDLKGAIPELGMIAEIQPEVVFSALSENLGPEHWQKLSETVVLKTRQENPDGIVIMLGTDTLAYVAAALSFSLIDLGIPLVCVGAQRSPDRPSSDATVNVLAATRFAAESRCKGVFVAMHRTESDESVAIHLGTRVRKNHTSRRDAFESIDVDPYAVVRNGKIEFTNKEKQGSDNTNSRYKLKTSFTDAVALVKFHPGLRPQALDYVTEEGIKGVIVEGTGLGHVSSTLVQKFSEFIRQGIFVGMTSQCIWGHVDLNVYETGSDLLDAGVIPLGNMLSETALAKLSWTLANFQDIEKVMLENMSFEMTPRITL
jgi:glutamyl-tRNA(Gln) amidotransferase subunit D